MTLRSVFQHNPEENSDLTRKRNSLRHKLFRYMFLLAALLMAAFLIGLSVIITALRQRNTFHSSLQMQMTVFSQDVSSEFEALQATGLQMSLSVTDQIRSYLNDHHMSFSEINDSETDLKAILTAYNSRLADPAEGIQPDDLFRTIKKGDTERVARYYDALGTSV